MKPRNSLVKGAPVRAVLRRCVDERKEREAARSVPEGQSRSDRRAASAGGTPTPAGGHAQNRLRKHLMILGFGVSWLAGCAMEPLTNEPPAPPVEMAKGEVYDEEMTEPGGMRADAVVAEANEMRDAKSAPAPRVRPGMAPPKDEPQERARSWFPESFLWEPRVLVPPSGLAELTVTAPDTLTTWRVLGLAHDRAGGQTGALTTFDTALPQWIEIGVPPLLRVGDVVELPVVVRGTEAVAGQLTATASGGLSGTSLASISVVAGGSQGVRARFEAVSAEKAKVEVRLPGVDALVREIPVVPTGRPVRWSGGGALSQKVTLPSVLPERGDPRTAALEVSVYPGPLAVLTSELERAAGGGEGLGALGLASRAEALAQAAGVELPAATLRKTRLIGRQRLLAAARSEGLAKAVEALLGMGADKDALETAFVARITRAQRADGTWALSDAAPLQAVVATTAATRVSLGEREKGPALRASGALERYASQVQDGYTASLALRAGVDGALGEALREKVLTSLQTSPDGRTHIATAPGVQSAFGGSVREGEALAWAAAALKGTPEGSALVTELLARYRAASGFGAGPAEALALEAVVLGLPVAAVPVEIVLRKDGEERGSARLDPSDPSRPVWISVPAGDGAGWTLEAQPAVGLAWGAALRSWVPWTGEAGLPGVEVTVDARPLRVGVSGTMTVTVAAPSGAAVLVEVGLPPGATLEGPRGAGGVAAWSQEGQIARLTFAPAGAGSISQVEMAIRPAFAGAFSGDPLRVVISGQEGVAPPLRWIVQP